MSRYNKIAALGMLSFGVPAGFSGRDLAQQMEISQQEQTDDRT